MYQVPIVLAVSFNANAIRTRIQDVDNHGEENWWKNLGLFG